MSIHCKLGQAIVNINILNLRNISSSSRRLFAKKIEYVPALGESITEGTISSWNKKLGDKVNVDDVIAIVETDKVTVDIKSTLSGVITNIFAAENVIVGNPLYEIDTDGSSNASELLATSTPNQTTVPKTEILNQQKHHLRKHRIKFLGKRSHIKASKASAEISKPSTITATANPTSSSNIKKPVKESTGVDFMTLKGGAQFGRPKLSPKEMEAIESGGAIF